MDTPLVGITTFSSNRFSLTLDETLSERGSVVKWYGGGEEVDTTLVKAAPNPSWMGRREMPFQNKVIVRNQRFDPFDPPTEDPFASITIPPETPQSGSLFRASPETLQCPGY